LKTRDKAHARRLLLDMRRDMENVTLDEAAKLRFDTLATRWLDSLRARLKSSTAARLEQCLENLKPYFRTVTLAGITAAHCKAWKTQRGDRLVPQTFAHELSALKRTFEYAIEQGVLYRNPARHIKRRCILSTRPKHIPTRHQFTELVAAIRQSDGRAESQEAARDGADMVELLAFSGMRKGEAGQVKWHHVDFERGLLMVPDGENRTKNYEKRKVPLSAALRELLTRLRDERKPSPSDNVSRIADPKKCLATTCRKMGLPYFTPHRFRDFFATTCIEQGVDVPTVARWLGHKDGGALLKKTYAHLRQEHSLQAMAKVIFDPTPATLATAGEDAPPPGQNAKLAEPAGLTWKKAAKLWRNRTSLGVETAEEF